MIPEVPIEYIVQMVRFAEDPSQWVESPPIYYPSMLLHHGIDIGYAIRCKVRCPNGEKNRGPLPLRHLYINYTTLEDDKCIHQFIESTMKAFKMDEYSILKSEERGMHIFQGLFEDLSF